MTYAHNSEIPSEIRESLSDADQTLFRETVNKSVEEGKTYLVAFAKAAEAVVERKNAGAVTVAKVSDELGLVFGWAIISKLNGKEYFDTQGDFISESVMLKAAADYMQNGAVAKEMHVGDEKGKVVFAWPMTEDIAKAMGISASQTGLMIAMKPDHPSMLEKFRNGTYSGFSIGGRGERVPVE